MQDQGGIDARSESLAQWALDLIAPTEGARRRAYASRRRVEAAVGVAVVTWLVTEGLIEIWGVSDGHPVLTPWGYEAGELLVLTPLGAVRCGVEMDEHWEVAPVEEQHRIHAKRKGRKAKREILVTVAPAEVPHWTAPDQRAERTRKPAPNGRTTTLEWPENVVDPTSKAG